MFDLVSFLPRAVMQGIPLLYGSTGEILTEKSGNLNLGLPGVMYVGAISGVIGSFIYEQRVPAEEMSGVLAVGIPLVCCLVGSLLMGLLYCFLTKLLQSSLACLFFVIFFKFLFCLIQLMLRGRFSTA